jgi:hypothetical protein
MPPAFTLALNSSSKNYNNTLKQGCHARLRAADSTWQVDAVGVRNYGSTMPECEHSVAALALYAFVALVRMATKVGHLLFYKSKAFILLKREVPSPFEDHAHISAKALSGQSDQVGEDKSGHVIPAFEPGSPLMPS